MNLGETCHLKRYDLVMVWRTMLLLCCYHCDCMQQHYDVTQFEYVLWRHTMHEWVMNIHYKTWIAQGRFTNMIRTPSKQWGVCDNWPDRIIMALHTVLALKLLLHLSKLQPLWIMFGHWKWIWKLQLPKKFKNFLHKFLVCSVFGTSDDTVITEFRGPSQ